MSILPYARNSIQCVHGPSAIPKDFKQSKTKQKNNFPLLALYFENKTCITKHSLLKCHLNRTNN